MSLVYKSLPYIDPYKIFAIVAADNHTIFLDSKLRHDYYGRYSFIGIDPLDMISSASIYPLAQQLQQFEQFKSSETETELPSFTGGLMGYLSYDYARNLESTLPNYYNEDLPVNDFWFGLYHQVFAFDHQKEICYLLITELPDTNIEQLLLKLQGIYDLATHTVDIPLNKPPMIELSSNFSRNEYIDAVNQAIEYIKLGDIFEVNIAQRFSGQISNNYDAALLYRYLQFTNPAPFAAYLNLDNLKILSASPERFLKVTGNKVEVRPIKGTIRRDPDLQIDRLLAQMLQSSQKDCAENIMIVDLMRNDLSKICIPDSVIVNQLCGLESFTNLHHLVSVINGQLKPGITIFDIIRAVFPAGSISGAPKIRAQQIIHELEQQIPRGVSYGNIGYIGFNGNIDLSVAIRTITLCNDNLSFHIGGAVTLYSDPVAEYEETMLKGQKLFESLGQ